jgi:excisionase family DNA binding protein
MNELEKLYKISEIAGWMRCSRASVYRILKSGSLDSVKRGGARLVTQGQLTEYLENLKKAA